MVSCGRVLREPAAYPSKQCPRVMLPGRGKGYLENGRSRVGGYKFLLFSGADISNYRLTTIVHMHMLNPHGLSAPIPQAT